jgi:hypothetical protein
MNLLERIFGVRESSQQLKQAVEELESSSAALREKLDHDDDDDSRKQDVQDVLLAARFRREGIK